MKHFSLKWLLLCSFLLVRFGYSAEIEVYHSGNSTPDKFIIDETGNTFSTGGFREAFANATTDGDSVYIPAGNFKLSQLNIESTGGTNYKNLKVHLDDNCVIFMSEDKNDYADEATYTSSANNTDAYRDKTFKWRSQYFLNFKNIDGLKISGNGTIVGNVRTSALTHGTHENNPNFDWTSNWSKHINTEKVNGEDNQYVYKATLLKIQDCENVDVKDLNIYYSSFWSFIVVESDNVTIDNVTVKCMPFGHSDGIDILNSRNVIVSNCYVSSGDDAICVKTDGGRGGVNACENILITDCVMKSPTNGFKIGTATQMDIKNIRVVNCTIDVPDPISQITSSDPIDSIGNNPSHNYTPPFSGVTIESVDGASVSDIFVDNIDIRNAKAPITIILNKRNDRNTNAVGSLSNIQISNLNAKIDDSNFSKDQQIASVISGIPGQLVKNVTLKNIAIETKGRITDLNKIFIINEVQDKDTCYPENYKYRLIFSDQRVPLKDASGNDSLDTNGNIVYEILKDASGNDSLDINGNIVYKTVFKYDSSDTRNRHYLPAYGFLVRHVDGFTMDNVVIKLEDNDIRPPLVLTDVQNVSINPGKFVRVNGNGSVRHLFVSKYETTELEYRALMSENSVNESHDMYNTQSNHPMTNVTWYDAINYCNQKSKIEGLDSVYSYSGSFISDGTAMYNFQADISKNGYRLPTDEEWEHLYLGGVDVALYGGFYFDVSLLNEYCWNPRNTVSGAQPVGLKKPNGFDLFDIGGNVFEWTHNDGDVACIRGGAYSMSSEHHFDVVNDFSPKSKAFLTPTIGFRVVRNAPYDMTPINMLLLD